MLSSIVRTTVHRSSVTDWLPQVERQPEVKSRRGWEKTSALSSITASPWVAKQLVALLGDSERERDSKVSPIDNLVVESSLILTQLVDAVLSALAALAKGNPTFANMLAKPSLERDREFLFSFVPCRRQPVTHYPSTCTNSLLTC
jgi:armadillo repeat-containing protein 8